MRSLSTQPVARRTTFLQWYGLAGGGFAWAGQVIVGFGLTQAVCSAGGRHWGIGTHVWEMSIMIAAATIAVGAEVAAFTLFRAAGATGGSHDEPPPLGRLHFFASASLVVNVLFLAIILMAGIGAIELQVCRQS